MANEIGTDSPRMPGASIWSAQAAPGSPHTPIRGKPLQPSSLAFEPSSSPFAGPDSPSSPTGTVRSSLTSPSRPSPPIRTSKSFTGGRKSGLGLGTPLSNTYLNSASIVIRADPTITTSFDPSDKELYHLWAPKS